MAALLPIKKETFHIDMLRDECRVIDRRGGDPAALKKAFAKMHRILKKMPPYKGDVVGEVRKIRDSGGRD